MICSWNVRAGESFFFCLLRACSLTMANISALVNWPNTGGGGPEQGGPVEGGVISPTGYG